MEQLDQNISINDAVHDRNYTANQPLYMSDQDLDNDDSFTAPSDWRHFVILCESPITLFFITVALNIVMKCRKLPFSIRYLSIMVLLAFWISAVFNIIISAVMILRPNRWYYMLVFDIRTFFGVMLLSIMWCTMCILTLERFIAIVFPYQYVRYVTKTALFVAVGVTWSLLPIISVVLVFTGWLNFCGHYDYISKCQILEIYRPFRMFILSTLCISFATILGANLKILLKLRQHEREIRALNVQPTETTAHDSFVNTPRPSIPIILIIVLSFFILQSPYLITIIAFEVRPDLRLQKWRVYLQTVSYFCHELNTYLTVYLYIWRFPECKMHFYKMLSKISERFAGKAEALRLHVFNIVTFERKSHAVSSESNL